MNELSPSSQDPEHHWVCYVCKSGLAATNGVTLSPGEVVSADYDPRIVLFGGERQDEVGGEPPLVIRLTDDEVELLRSGGRDAVAATWYGPPGQSKVTNQDFALAGRVRDPTGSDFLFAAVADGVSTKTFWAARAARISCIVSMRCAVRMSRNGKSIDVGDFDDFRSTLSTELRRALKHDMMFLREYTCVPDGWDHSIYMSNIERTQYWYNTTLLVSIVNSRAALILYAGDGGVFVRKRERDGTYKAEQPLKSGIDLRIETFVSLEVTANQFQGVIVRDVASLAGLVVILSTDGVDRTLQMNDQESYDALDLSSQSSAFREIKRLGNRECREIDNYSIAAITWPPHEDCSLGAQGLSPIIDAGNYRNTPAPSEELGIIHDLDVRKAESHRTIDVTNLTIGLLAAFAAGSIVGAGTGFFLRPHRLLMPQESWITKKLEQRNLFTKTSGYPPLTVNSTGVAVTVGVATPIGTIPLTESLLFVGLDLTAFGTAGLKMKSPHGVLEYRGGVLGYTWRQPGRSSKRNRPVDNLGMVTIDKNQHYHLYKITITPTRGTVRSIIDHTQVAGRQ